MAQRKATKYILLNDYSMSYKNRLWKLHLLSISLWLDLLDLMFLMKCLEDEEDNNIMNIREFITISTATTRAGSSGLCLNANLIPTH